MGNPRRMSTEPCADSLFLFDSEIEAPSLHLEQMLFGRGRRAVAGVDEAGRGPLAGPVVAAAVILDADNIPDGLNDSKKLDAEIREELFGSLLHNAYCAWSAVDAAEIDRINIRQATLKAMWRAVRGLSVQPDSVLVDGRDVPPPLAEIGQAIVRGDAISLSIGAASIVAKVVRDKIMTMAERDYPAYGFASHKGYGTKAHLTALHKHGPCVLHRRSYAPVSAQIPQPQPIVPADAPSSVWI